MDSVGVDLVGVESGSRFRVQGPRSRVRVQDPGLESKVQG